MQKFLESVSAAYERIRKDPQQWAELEGEQSQLDGTLLDGLNSEEEWMPDNMED